MLLSLLAKMRCSRSCFLWIIMILLISFVGYLQIQDPRAKLAEVELDHWSYNEQQSAVQISSHEYKQASTRRSLLKNSNVHRYMLSLSYWEQLTMAVRNLFSLTCFGNVWNMSVVQPFTYNSRLYGLPNLKPDDNMKETRRAEDLQLIFNTDSMNNALEKNNFMKMTLFQTFLTNAYRGITVIHFISTTKEVHELPVMKGETGTILREKFKHKSVVDCIDILDGHKQLILSHLNSEVQKLSSSYPKFKIVKYFCVNMSTMVTPEALSSKLQLGNPDQNESVIVVNWRGTSAQTVLVDTAKGSHPNNRIVMNSSCKNKKVTKHDIYSFIQYSQLVLSTTKLFLKNKGLDVTDYVAVHIRGEKMGLREPRLRGSFKSCLEKLSTVIDDVIAMKNRSVVYITDYGKYSSDTCKRCKSGVKVSKWIEEQRGVEELKFDPTSMNLPPDSGLAAAVETNVLASARYLIVCGGGAFQAQVINSFRHHGNNAESRIFRVCTDDSNVPDV